MKIYSMKFKDRILRRNRLIAHQYPSSRNFKRKIWIYFQDLHQLWALKNPNLLHLKLKDKQLKQFKTCSKVSNVTPNPNTWKLETNQAPSQTIETPRANQRHAWQMNQSKNQCLIKTYYKTIEYSMINRLTMQTTIKHFKHNSIKVNKAI